MAFAWETQHHSWSFPSHLENFGQGVFLRKSLAASDESLLLKTTRLTLNLPSMSSRVLIQLMENFLNNQTVEASLTNWVSKEMDNVVDMVKISIGIATLAGLVGFSFLRHFENMERKIILSNRYAFYSIFANGARLNEPTSVVHLFECQFFFINL